MSHVQFCNMCRAKKPCLCPLLQLQTHNILQVKIFILWWPWTNGNRVYRLKCLYQGLLAQSSQRMRASYEQIGGKMINSCRIFSIYSFATFAIKKLKLVISGRILFSPVLWNERQPRTQRNGPPDVRVRLLSRPDRHCRGGGGRHGDGHQVPRQQDDGRPGGVGQLQDWREADLCAGRHLPGLLHLCCPHHRLLCWPHQQVTNTEWAVKQASKQSIKLAAKLSLNFAKHKIIIWAKSLL